MQTEQFGAPASVQVDDFSLSILEKREYDEKVASVLFWHTGASYLQCKPDTA